jgi:hypothetical protein
MDLTFQLATNITYQHVIEKIEQLTFPPVRKKILTIPLHEPFTGIWALRDNQIVGIILADRNPEGYSELFSFLVIPKERNKGIGNQLLSQLAVSLKSQGIGVIRSRYRTDWGSQEVIEKMLKTHGWESPQLLRVIAEIDINHFPTSPWPAMKLSSDYTLFNWTELTKDDRNRIDRLIINKQVPPEFNPYQHEDKIFLPSSFGLRNKGVLIGWNIVYTLTEDTIEYNNLYLVEEFRKLGHAITLIHKSTGEQYKLNIPKATWLINADNKPTLKIVKRITANNLNKFIEVRASHKLL